MKLRLFTAGILLPGMIFAGSAEDTDLSGYTGAETETSLESIVANGGFERGADGWILKKDCRIEKNGGRNGTATLRYERRNPKEYQLVGTPVKLEPGKFYRFGAWIKTEQVTNPNGRGGAAVALEFSKDGGNGRKAFLSGRYPRGVTGTADWTWISDVVRVPKNAIGAHITLYLHPRATGTAWFDDISVQEQGSNLWSLTPIAPFGILSGKSVPVRLSHDGKEIPAGSYAVQMNLPSAKFSQRLKAGAQMEFSIPESVQGNCDIEFMILDTAKKKILFSRVFPLNVRRGNGSKVTLDASGRMLVDGHPFMPLGIFGSSLIPAQLEMLREAGFNCILPYGSMSLRADPQAPPSREQIVKAMDIAAAKGMKVIFSIKDVGSSQNYGFDRWMGIDGYKNITADVVNLLKDHPALLAWFSADEAPVSQVPRLTEIRRICNRLDPEHPVYGVFYQYEELPFYGRAFDVIGIDPYPLSGNTLRSAVFAMDQARRTGLPVWSVPQIFNWAEYKKEEKGRPNPSGEKMRSLILLEAAMGARGFILYSFYDLRPPRMPEGNFEKEWPKIKRIVALMKRLEPYIMSGEEPVILRKNEIVAAELRNSEGRKAILICSVGPGKCRAELKLKGKFRSEYGRTKQDGDVLIFEGEDISSDVLWQE